MGYHINLIADAKSAIDRIYLDTKVDPSVIQRSLEEIQKHLELTRSIVQTNAEERSGSWRV